MHRPSEAGGGRCLEHMIPKDTPSGHPTQPGPFSQPRTIITRHCGATKNAAKLQKGRRRAHSACGPLRPIFTTTDTGVCRAPPQQRRPPCSSPVTHASADKLETGSDAATTEGVGENAGVRSGTLHAVHGGTIMIARSAGHEVLVRQWCQARVRHESAPRHSLRHHRTPPGEGPPASLCKGSASPCPPFPRRLTL